MYTAGCYYIAACSYCLERPKLQYLVNCNHLAQNCSRKFHALENLQLIFLDLKILTPQLQYYYAFQTIQIETAVTLKTDKSQKYVRESEWYSNRKLLNNVSFLGDGKSPGQSPLLRHDVSWLTVPKAENWSLPVQISLFLKIIISPEMWQFLTLVAWRERRTWLLESSSASKGKVLTQCWHPPVDALYPD